MKFWINSVFSIELLQGSILSWSFHSNLIEIFSGDDQRPHNLQPQPHLHILTERRPDDPPANSHKPAFIIPDDIAAKQGGYIHHVSDAVNGQIVTLDPHNHHHHHQQSSQIHLYLHEEGMVGVDESLDTSGNITGSDFDEDGEDPHMPFSELLSDPEKDEGQDPPSSTTGDPNEKPGKRASQGSKTRRFFYIYFSGSLFYVKFKIKLSHIFTLINLSCINVHFMYHRRTVREDEYQTFLRGRNNCF